MFPKTETLLCIHRYTIKVLVRFLVHTCNGWLIKRVTVHSRRVSVRSFEGTIFAHVTRFFFIAPSEYRLSSEGTHARDFLLYTSGRINLVLVVSRFVFYRSVDNACEKKRASRPGLSCGLLRSNSGRIQ